MQIVVTGASGFIGRHLIAALRDEGHDVASMGRGESVQHRWDYLDAAPSEVFENTGAVIHLAGEPVAQRWTPEVKRKIRDSRVLSTERLVQGLSVTRSRPGILVCASAVGYYGDRGDEVLAESAAPGTGFLADVCREWESKADLAASLGMRVAKIRTGIVLGPDGGAIQKMLTPFKLGVGGRLGRGKQWMPWIHIDDIVGIFRHAVETPVNGALNGSAPGIVTNADFTRVLGRALHRPTVLPTPQFVLRMMFGEMADAMFDSQRAVPKSTERSGYKFRYPKLEEALASLRL